MKKILIMGKYFAIVLSIALLFHNCSDSPLINFTDNSPTKITSNLNSQAQSGGEPFLGKPREGDYVRTFPSYQCENMNAGLQGLLAVTSSVNVTSDTCRDVDIDFNFADKVLEYSGYNRDYLGVGTAVYEYVKKDSSELPATEVWCRQHQEKTGFDIVVKVDNDLKQAQAKFYVGELDQSQNLTTYFVAPFSVERNQTGNILRYISDKLMLNVTIPSASDQQGSAVALTRVDGREYSLNMSCRVANRAIIEEMGTGLSTMSRVTSFTTDSQEAICAHPSAVMCENMEIRTLGSPSTMQGSAIYKNAGWGFGGFTDISLVNSQSFDSGKSIELDFPMGANVGPNNFSTNFSSASLSTAYARFYVKFSANFKWSAAGQELGYFWGDSLTGMTIDGQQRLGVRNQNYQFNNFYSANVLAPVALAVNQWHCVEYAVTYNTTPSALDGAVQLWVDDQLLVNQQGIQVSASPNPIISDFVVRPTWGCVGGQDPNNLTQCLDQANPDNNHPNQQIWLDNFVVAKQRVGCY